MLYFTVFIEILLKAAEKLASFPGPTRRSGLGMRLQKSMHVWSISATHVTLNETVGRLSQVFGTNEFMKQLV